jgi:hypothetical protein
MGGIGYGAAGDMPLLNLEAGVAQRAGGILEQKLLLGKAHRPEQVSRLLVTIVIDGMVPIGRVDFNGQRRFDQPPVPIRPRAIVVLSPSPVRSTRVPPLRSCFHLSTACRI